MSRETLRALSVGALICLLAAPAFPKKTAPKDAEARRQAKLFQTKLNKDKQILHALDRLTFGPRPGDVAQVKRMGLKKWIDLQLHPERIAEPKVLQARLAPLESLRMTPFEVVQHYPTPQMIKAVAEGRQQPPEDPVLRASVERLAARYRVKKAEAAADTTNTLDGMEPAKPLTEILTPEELAALKSGQPEQKRAVLASLAPDKLEDL